MIYKKRIFVSVFVGQNLHAFAHRTIIFDFSGIRTYVLICILAIFKSQAAYGTKANSVICKLAMDNIVKAK
jgi:hypothetical protein